MTLRKRLFSVAGTLLLAVSPTALVLAQDAQAPTTAVETPAVPLQAKPDGKDRPKPKEDTPPAAQNQPAAQPVPAAEPKPRPAPGNEAATPGAKPALPPKAGKDAGNAEPAKGQPPASQAAPANHEAQAPQTVPGGQENAATPTKPHKPQQQLGGAAKQDQAPSAAAAPPDQGLAADLLRDQRPAAQLSDDDLRQRLLGSRRRLADPTLSPAQRDTLRRLVQSSRQEFQRRQETQRAQESRPTLASQPPQAGTADIIAPPRNRPLPSARQPAVQPQPPADSDDGRPVTPQARGAADPAAEQRAVSLLADETPPDRMSDQVLRQRLGAYRDALAGANLSPATERGLVQRLDAARDALRVRVAEQEDGIPLPGRSRARPLPMQPGWDPQFGRPQFRLGSPRPQDIPAILADRRPSAVLTLNQLNRRILVFRDAANDPRYSPEDREAFAQYLQSDRTELRNRLLSDRGLRGSRLQRAVNGGRLHLDVDIAPRGLRTHSIWAAEVDDDQIEQQFAARPLQPLPQRFARATLLAQPEMVMEQPFVRRAIPSVELDTIHFGFNEAFIREEEVAHLDRIGRIIERIVAAHPDEVFVIEGNTDAVGEDSYNLQLSKKRADAVKQALTQFYLIAPRNLVTAGLGEHYLKIPTQDPDQENRRVTLRRITPVLAD